MTEATDRDERIREMYAAFNARDLDALLAFMAPDVDWPNAWEGGRVHGRRAVRDYWTRQWAVIDPRAEPVALDTRPDGRVAVRVEQVVRDRDGTPLMTGHVLHVYAFRGDLVAAMDVEESVGG